MREKVQVVKFTLEIRGFVIREKHHCKAIGLDFAFCHSQSLLYHLAGRAESDDLCRWDHWYL